MIPILKSSMAIEVLLQTIINTYFGESYCITVVSESSLDLTFPNSFTFINPNNTDNTTLTHHLLIVSENGCSDYIVRIESPKVFMKAFEDVNHLGSVRRSDRKIIFLPLYEDEKNNENILEILSLRETSFVANILLITKMLVGNENDCDNFNLVTHKFVGKEDVTKLILLDTWNSCLNKFDKEANLFPHDMSNMEGKIVKVASFSYKPYVIIDLDTDEASNDRDGTEIRIVDEFCRWINCTIEIVRDDENLWGEIYENQTGVGVLGSVVEDRADLGITALYSWYEEFLYLDFSVSSIRSAVTCVAPAPRLLGSWETPLLPFTWWMWTAVISTIIFITVALTIAQGCNPNHALLTTLAMMIGQSQDDQGSWRIRSVTGWLLLGGLIISSAYGAGLASTFTVPKYEKSIDTIQDIVDAKLEWGATHDAWIFSLSLSEEPLIKQLVRQFRTYDAEKLREKTFTRSMAFSIEKLPAGYFAIGDYISKEAMRNLMLMVEDFYYEQCVVMLRKSSPYTAKVSDLIGRLHESGLMLIWETQVALKYLTYEVQLEVKLSRLNKDVDVKPLTIENVLGVFVVYLIGISISIIIFIIESILFKYQTRLNVDSPRFAY